MKTGHLTPVQMISRKTFPSSVKILAAVFGGEIERGDDDNSVEKTYGHCDDTFAEKRY